jgi:type VI secretion system secreted protein VgrG
MNGDTDLTRFLNQAALLDTVNRPLRMRLAHVDRLSDDLLLPQKIAGSEAVCGGLEYRVLCLATDAALPLKELIALPVALEFVTDRGQLRTVCGIVAEASAGDSDGGLASYHLLVRDALAIMEQRINTRVFRNLNEFDIVERILAEWRQTNPIMAAAFEREVDPGFHQRSYPPREFTMQYQESDAAFIRRLLCRRGIGWYFRAGRSRDTGVDPLHDNVPAHTLVLFNNVDSLAANAAGTVRYHRDNATEERDTITSWRAARSLRAGSVASHSWDYKNPQAGHFMSAAAATTIDQGSSGNAMAASLNDYRVLVPHAGADNEDLARLGQLRMRRHDLDSKCFHGAGSVRDFCAGEYFTLTGHPEIDTHPAPEREFVITALEVEAQNNLPAALAARVARLFAGIGGAGPAGSPATAATTNDTALAETPVRFRMRFTAVRRGVAIVPAFDPATVPRASLQSAVVVGPPDEEVHCDALGRVKIRFPATRAADHGQGAGASDTPADSAWVRVASNWAGNGPGALHQCGALGLPRVGAEVLVDFLGGDPDKPVIVGQLYNQQGLPPALSERGDLPGNRYLSGIRSREVHGERGNVLRFDDSRGQISIQLASDHGASQVNLGWLCEPRADGHGEARGEGAELRSDRQTVVRGGQGVLVTAGASDANGGKLLDRDELTALSTGLQKLAGQLSALAQTHAGDAAAGPELAQLIDKLKQWNTGAPIVAVGGPAGVIVAGGQNLALGANINVDVVSGGATVLSSGAGTVLRAAHGVSLFAHQDGAKLTAASGKVQIQAQDDALELLAKKVLDIISTTDWINLKAKQGVRIHGGGSELVIDAGGINGYTAGKSTMHAASHQTLEAQKVDATFPGFRLCPSLASGEAHSGGAAAPLE